MTRAILYNKIREETIGIMAASHQYEYNKARKEEILRHQKQAGSIEVETTIIDEDDHSRSPRLLSD